MEELRARAPDPFDRVRNVGFSVRSPALDGTERARRATVFLEGEPRPLSRLMPLLASMALATPATRPYRWSEPMELAESVWVVGWRDASLEAAGGPGAVQRLWVRNLVTLVPFDFLRDCAEVAGVALAEVITLLFEAPAGVYEQVVRLDQICARNGAVSLAGF